MDKQSIICDRELGPMAPHDLTFAHDIKIDAVAIRFSHKIGDVSRCGTRCGYDRRQAEGKGQARCQAPLRKANQRASFHKSTYAICPESDHYQ